MADSVKATAAEIKPSGEVMERAFEDSYDAGKKIKASLWDLLVIPGAPALASAGINHYWEDMRTDVLEIIKSAEQIGKDMTAAVAAVTGTVAKGRRITSEIDTMTAKVVGITKSLGGGFKVTHPEIYQGMRKAVGVINTGKSGIETALNTVNSVIDRFVQITELMQQWVRTVTATKDAVYKSTELLDEKTKVSVRKAIDDMVAAFSKMHEGTKKAVRGIVRIAPDLVKVTTDGQKGVAASAKTSRAANAEVQTKSFKKVDDPNFKPV